MDESDKRKVEEDFWIFMRDSIWYCAKNATRSATAAERRNSGISLEALTERRLRDYTSVEDNHELGDYKYNGLKKARAKKNGRRKNHN